MGNLNCLKRNKEYEAVTSRMPDSIIYNRNNTAASAINNKIKAQDKINTTTYSKMSAQTIKDKEIKVKTKKNLNSIYLNSKLKKNYIKESGLNLTLYKQYLENVDNSNNNNLDILSLNSNIKQFKKPNLKNFNFQRMVLNL